LLKVAAGILPDDTTLLSFKFWEAALFIEYREKN
jgi:hypothetical protein